MKDFCHLISFFPPEVQNSLTETKTQTRNSLKDKGHISLVSLPFCFSNPVAPPALCSGIFFPCRVRQTCFYNNVSCAMEMYAEATVENRCDADRQRHRAKLSLREAEGEKSSSQAALQIPPRPWKVGLSALASGGPWGRASACVTHPAGLVSPCLASLQQ